ncbi:MAG: glycosyltransferase [Anaerolineales bacterium]
MILVLFSASYPYDTATDQTFLKAEIQHLAVAFEKVVLVPRNCKGQQLPVPNNVIVVDGYSSFLKNPLKIFLVPKILTSNIFYRDLAASPMILFRPQLFFRLMVFLAGAYLTENWVAHWIKEQGLNVHDCIFYTYWFDHAAMGIGIVKHTYPDLKLVSRAHGYDIYEELYFPFYWPCRLQALSTLDKLFPASEDGANYFREKYPHFASIVESAHLGVKDPGFQSNPSMDNVFRIVSCAHIVSLKRMDLLLKGIALAARLRPEQKFEWVHFGGGIGQKALEKIVQQSLSANLKCYITGNVPNEQILLHYKENPVDVFINVSKTEGGAPVSIQEAISCGIPIIATSVGGNPEIVSERNGIILRSNPIPQEIANAIFVLLDNPEMTVNKRRGSREVWSEQYNADVNFRLFAERLKSIREDQ